MREARETHRDPFEALLALLPQTLYSFGCILFRGKIVDVQRETRSGFALGRTTIESLRWRGAMEIRFQNENLIARVDGKVRAIVPDLICVLDGATAEPITTEMLRYGQRVTVMAVAVPPIMRTPEALAVFGPPASAWPSRSARSSSWRPASDAAYERSDWKIWRAAPPFSERAGAATRTSAASWRNGRWTSAAGSR